MGIWVIGDGVDVWLWLCNFVVLIDCLGGVEGGVWIGFVDIDNVCGVRDGEMVWLFWLGGLFLFLFLGE